MENTIINDKYNLYKSSSDKYVIFVHGMVETTAGYEKVKNFLNANGINVVLYDNRGHGKSAKRLGHLETFESYKMVGDLVEIEKHIKDNYNPSEVIIVGHSMGSGIVRAAMKSVVFDKVVLNGAPASLNSFVSNFALFVFLFIKNEKETSIFNKLVFNGYNKKIKNPVSSNSWVCSNSEYVKMYDEDKFSGFLGTGGFYQEIIRVLAMASEKSINATKVLITTGSMDPVTKMGKTSFALEKKLETQGCKCKVISYNNMRHFIYDEVDCEVCFDDLLEFIKE